MMDVPFYDPKSKETINQYIRRVEKYKIFILKEKYDMILNFVNDLLNLDPDTRFHSLTKFTNVKESILLKNDISNKNVMQKYCELFKNKFEIDIDPKNEKNDKNESNDKDIITFIIKLLDLIDYTLIKREFKGEFIYSIRKT